MADIYDVQTVLANLAQQAVYPNGLTQPSVANCPIRIYPGWPIPDTLDADLLAGTAHVSIFPTNIARPTTRFDTEWQTISVNIPTLTLTVSGYTITLGGTVSVNQATMIIVSGIGFSRMVQANDTINSIAAAMASLIPNANAVGNVITVFGLPSSLIAHVIVSGSTAREVAREKRLVICTVWAFNPLVRSKIAYAIQVLFAATYRIILPDSYYAQLTYSGSNESDELERQVIYRRDIHFIVEFATTQSAINTTIGINNIYAQPPTDYLSTISGEDITTLDGENISVDGNH